MGPHECSEFIHGDIASAEIEARNKSDGKKCYPICMDCFDEGKKVVYYAKSKVNQQVKRREDAANKSAAAAERSKKN